MLFFLKYLSAIWGPMRMFGSYLVLLCAGALVASFAMWRLLPRFFDKMPHDRGKGLGTAAGKESKGKPTGAGRWMFFILLPIFLLFLPPSIPGIDKTSTLSEVMNILGRIAASPREWLHFLSPQLAIVLCMFFAMLTGYSDDASKHPWGELKKGLLDAVIALFATGVLYFLGEEQCRTLWIPGTKQLFEVPWWVFIPGGTCVLWISMNATNCSDGVDGLVGSLTLVSLFTLAAFLYGVVGHVGIAKYLIVPHNPEGARWAILCSITAGGVGGYLWHNAYPSRVLMGDAGSRQLGILVGIAVLTSGNPFLLIAVCPIVVVNGLSGLAKLAILRTLRRFGVNTANPYTEPEKNPNPAWIVRILHKWRFPLHDQFRKKREWSPTQVVIRFMLLQAFFMPIALLLILKIR